jgi:hypothetical protein
MTYPTIPGFQGDSPECISSIDRELVEVWKAMKRFSSLINLVSQANGGIAPETLLQTMASVMYRLFDMRFETGSLDEIVRLGLLSFSSNVFLQWKDIRQSYQSFYTTYERQLRKAVSSNTLSPRLMLWFYTIGSISTYAEAEGAWLRSSLGTQLELNHVVSWSEMQSIMHEFMWIGMIHDEPGKEIFDCISVTP